ncbi:PQQ-binding-like beta-propeller repeat protein, partial [Streptomyces sp. GC420]
MTQPPNQPPQGGFGAPQEPQGQPPQGQPPQGPPPPAQPPAGGPAPGQPPQGYGFPPSSPPPPGQPPQGGYGFPQGPGVPPGQPAPVNPYAQPGPYVQPGPYGQPPQGYGYPPPPGGQFPGAPAPAGQGGGPFKGKPAVIIGAAVAALLVIGTGVFFATAGGDDDKKPVAGGSDKPGTDPTGPVDDGDGSGDGDDVNGDPNAGRKEGESKLLWQADAPDAPGSGADAPGLWFAGDVVAKAAYKQIAGYDAASGKEAWKIELPAKICGAPQQTTDDGKVVIGFMNGTSDKADCNQLTMIDIESGKRAWTKEVPEEGLFDIMTDLDLAISGNTVTVSRMGPSSAFRISDGKKLFSKLAGSCQPDDYAGGKRLIAVETCTDQSEQAQEVDPATGRAKWTFKVPKGMRINKVYSTSPVVLSLVDEDNKKWSVVTLKDGSGSVRSQLTSKDSFAPQCGLSILSRDLQGCQGIVVSSDTLYLPTDGLRGNDVVAFSLDTGKEKWRSAAPEDRRMYPLRMDGSNLVVYIEASYDAGGQIGRGGPDPPGVLRRHAHPPLGDDSSRRLQHGQRPVGRDRRLHR